MQRTSIGNDATEKYTYYGNFVLLKVEEMAVNSEKVQDRKMTPPMHDAESSKWKKEEILCP